MQQRKLTLTHAHNPAGTSQLQGSMCMVDMCGECSAKCVTYAELGAGLNKVLSSVGLSSE